MKLALYDAGLGAGPRVGVVQADQIIDAGVEGGLVTLMADWPAARAMIAARIAGAEVRPLAAVKLRAPVPRPGKIFAIGLNYADHIAESRAETPKHQVWFTKAVTAINGPLDQILIAQGAPFVDYEVELVAVIGRRAKHVSLADAPGVIFGYCVGNDVTERLWQHRTAQWSLGKSFDTHAPIGPWITTADEIGDPHRLDIRCLVNGEVRQASNTRHLVFDVFAQIEHLSQAMTLEPGDLIFTGTPGGVGAAMEPRRFLKPGDVVRCEIEGLGAIEAALAAEA
jgi:2-keto-4-pentenoate hydratase/2-oxohepta-3-ene-1,7-dioic acid hydratase in catechol pathway